MEEADDTSLEERDDFTGTARFVVRRALGEGAFGVVYEAFDRERAGTVALKRLRVSDGAALYRFKQEFRKLAGVSHRNLVTLHELHFEDGRWFFAMEYVDGVDLLAHVRGERPPDRAIAQLTIDSESASLLRSESVTGPTHPSAPSTDSVRSTGSTGADTASQNGSSRSTDDAPQPQSGVVFVRASDRRPSAVATDDRPSVTFREDLLRSAFAQLAAGLDALHCTGLLHRDVKPSNVLVSRSGRVVLLDFGLVSDQQEENDSRVVGTPAYMSPEQATGAPTDEATDWYSVGVVLFEALVGRLPFEGNPREILANKLTTDAPDPRQLASGVPDDLAELCLALLRVDPLQRPSGPDVIEALSSRRTPRKRRTGREPRRAMVGRESHEAALWAALDRARSGAVEAVLLRGRSGTGKSTLAKRFLEQVRSRIPNAVVLAGQCYEQESVPFEALDALVDALAQHLRAMDAAIVASIIPPNAAALTKLFPVLQRVRTLAFIEESEPLDPQELRRRATSALRALLDGLSLFGPVVLFVDNLHWGDADSALVFDELLRSGEGRSLLFIATYRTEDGDPTRLLQWFDRDRLAAQGAALQTLEVEPLEADDALSVARSLVNDNTEAGRARAQQIARESCGNPYFLDVLARHFVADSAPHDGGGSADAPIELDAVLWSASRALDPGARALLEVVAVAGVPLPWSVARAAAALGDDAADSLARLRAQKFVKLRRSDQDRLECHHDRVRVAIASRLDPASRTAHHRALAARLALEPDVEPDLLALHYEGAGALSDAALYTERAAERAGTAFAFDRSARLYRKAIELRGALGAVSRELYVSLGAALANAGRGYAAAEAYLEAAKTAPELEALELRLRAADPLLRSGHIDEGVAQLRMVLDGLGLEFPKSPQRALLSLALSRAKLALRGERSQPRPASELDPRDILRVDTCRAAAQGLGIVDNIRGAEFNTRHYLLALELGEPYRVARATAIEGGFSGSLGASAHEKTQRIERRSFELAARSDNPHALAMAWLCKGIAACMEGRFIDSVSSCQRAADVLRERCVSPWDLAQAQFYTLAPRVWTGEIPAIDEAIPSLLAEYESRSDRLASTSLLTYLAFLPALARDDAPAGRRLVDDAIARWSSDGFHVQHWWALRAHVESDLYEGDGEAALRRLDARWPDLERSLLLRVQYARIEALQLRARALVLAANGWRARWRLARALRDADAIVAERIPWAVGLGSLLRAGVASRRGDPDTRLRALVSAERALTVADMRLYAAVARRQRGALVGGDDGAALIERADLEARACGVRNVRAASGWLAPA